MSSWNIRQATPYDWQSLATLLMAANLPLAGAETHLSDFFLAFRHDDLIGSAGLERYGDTALLRSVAVTVPERGHNLGQALVQQVLAYAASLEVRAVVLLTTTAADFFHRFGFRPINRAEFPLIAQASVEFQEACPSSARAMSLVLEVEQCKWTPVFNWLARWMLLPSRISLHPTLCARMLNVRDRKEYYDYFYRVFACCAIVSQPSTTGQSPLFPEQRAAGQDVPPNSISHIFFTPGDMGLLFITSLFVDSYMTLTQAARHPELWSAAVDMFGLYDLITFSLRIPESWKPYFELVIGHPERDREFLLERSPRTYMQQISCPLLVIQGKNDPRVIERESRDVVEQLQAAGKQVEYLVFEDEGHDVFKYANRVTCYTAIAEFFKTHL